MSGADRSCATRRSRRWSGSRRRSAADGERGRQRGLRAGRDDAQPSVFSARASADFRRAAVFRCITPLPTARSSVRMASWTAALDSADFPAMAVSRRLDRRADRAARRAVALPPLLALLDPLDGGAGIRHGTLVSSGSRVGRHTKVPSGSGAVKEFVPLSEPSHSDRAAERGLVSAVGTIGLATLASRILGYARDIVVARTFGAGPMTDAFFVAFRIPNLLRRLLAEGALSTSVVPVFSATLHREGPGAFARMAQVVAGAGAGRARRGLGARHAAGAVDRGRHGARLARRRRPLRPRGDAHARHVSVPGAGRPGRPRDGRAERAPPLLHGGPVAGRHERGDDRRGARPERPAVARPSSRWRSESWPAGSDSSSSSSPRCGGWESRCGPRSTGRTPR